MRANQEPLPIYYNFLVIHTDNSGQVYTKKINLTNYGDFHCYATCLSKALYDLLFSQK